ncbi:MAG: hypothetical protein IPN66_07210 [Candidatus Competibacteraceae bacterium]|nr:hypothetical protein [Candidatus Competibacteraceae bacterium]MBK8897005.1 hypothetical protein [Candidatus Competibacteraceae bacterium]
MSNAHSIPVSNSLFDADAIDGGNYRDGLNNCAAVLWMLADLFDYDDLPTALDSPRARRGMFLQLQGVASALDSIGEFLTEESARRHRLDEVEREARRRSTREEEDHLAEDPDVIKKRVIVAEAMADVFRQVFEKPKDKIDA